MFFKVKNGLLNINEIDSMRGVVNRGGSTTGNSKAYIQLTLYLPQEAPLLFDDAEEFLSQIDNLHYNERNRLFSKKAQEYLGNLLVEKDRKQKELDSEVS